MVRSNGLKLGKLYRYNRKIIPSFLCRAGGAELFSAELYAPGKWCRSAIIRNLKFGELFLVTKIKTRRTDCNYTTYVIDVLIDDQRYQLRFWGDEYLKDYVEATCNNTP